MKERMELGPTPSGETCAQLGVNYDSSRAKKECRVFIEQLRRTFAEPLESVYGVDFMVTSNPHDFGIYHEVAVTYDEDDEAAVELAFHIESNTPEWWDEQSKAALGISLAV